jgi:hypothetical protein
MRRIAVSPPIAFSTIDGTEELAGLSAEIILPMLVSLEFLSVQRNGFVYDKREGACALTGPPGPVSLPFLSTLLQLDNPQSLL